MPTDFAELFAKAKQERNAGRRESAERAYAGAAAQARAESDSGALAHALRHVSDLERERGAIDEALAAAVEAVSIYRSQPAARPLDLANALRLNALALTDRAGRTEAAPLWEEARNLYRSEGVSAGVEEAESHLRTG